MVRVLAAIVISAMALALGACASTAETKSFDLAVDPSTTMLALDVENVRGTVEVRTTAKDSTAHIHATLEADYGNSTKEAKTLHEHTRVDATLEESDGRGTVRVRATNPEATDAIAIRIYIELPRCDGVRIVNRGGDVEVVGTKGATDITNRDGAIEVRTNNALTNDVRLLNTDGSIYLQVPPGSAGKIDLATIEGQSVLKDVSGNIEHTSASHEAVLTTLAGGTNTILARTNHGDIRFWIMEDPEALTRIYKIPMPDPRKQLFKEGSRRYTRNLPDDEPPRKRGTRSNPGG